MTKKKEITLQDLFNKMSKEFTDLKEKLAEISECSKMEQPDTEKHSETEIPNTEYVTITADDVYIGGNSAKMYHGQEIYSRYFCSAYFKEARDIIREEYGYELLEIHCLQSSTDGDYAESGNPVPDEKGKSCWVRVKYKDKDGTPAASLWVFNYTFSSDSDCAYSCAYRCGYGVRYDSVMRSGLFGSVCQ